MSTSSLGAELSIWHEGGTAWTLLREHGQPVELRVEGEREPLAAGSVIQGRIARVLPGIEAAFVDIGGERHGFLQGVERAVSGREVLVQVEREALPGKGPRLTTTPVLPGWRLVYLTGDSRRSVSRRIRDEVERARLQQIMDALPGEEGFIARTAAVGADGATLRHEAEALREEWRATVERAVTTRPPAVLWTGPDLVVRALQASGTTLERIVVDDLPTRDRLIAFLTEKGSGLAGRVELAEPVDEWRQALRGVVDRTLRPKVWLRSGGYIVIEPTEALTSVDVNSGKFLGKGGAARTAMRINIEAAEEVARQLRLRDIGGLIVIDFIQLESAADRSAVLDALRDGLARDPSRTRTTGFSELGLVEVARTRTRRSPIDRSTVVCRHCAGSGRRRA